jgi:regulatory protein
MSSTESPKRMGETATHEQRLQGALAKAFARLNRREHTAQEITAHLERGGIDQPTIAAALQELEQGGYVDDARYARLFAEDRRTLDGWGPDRIRRALAEKGVAREHINAVLAQARSQAGESELDRALALLRRRFPTPPQDRRDRDRALGVLIRKGYNSDLALDAITAHTRGD